MRSSVVLPAPFGPARPTRSPSVDLPGHVVEQDAFAERFGEAGELDQTSSGRALRLAEARARRPTRMRGSRNGFVR